MQFDAKQLVKLICKQFKNRTMVLHSKPDNKFNTIISFVKKNTTEVNKFGILDEIKSIRMGYNAK